jgi:hypothetical protein
MPTEKTLCATLSKMQVSCVVSPEARLRTSSYAKTLSGASVYREPSTKLAEQQYILMAYRDA